MKTTNYIKSIALALATAFSVSLFVLADGESKGPSGRYLDDATAGSVVASGSYVTFSTVYNGRRYYLGVDTVAAKADTPKDTVTYYEGPNYATMWRVGPNWSETGTEKANKDYTRTIQSVWMDEQVNRDRFLALGAGSATYNTLILRDTSVVLTRWNTAKDTREQNRYINGFLYFYSDATGVETYRYLTYDPLYGFSRLYGARPANSQRISLWDRKTGSDLIYHMTPSTITFGYSDHDTIQPITSQVIYYQHVDRFRSRFDHVDIFASRSEAISDQQRLIDDFGLVGHYEWKSNPIDETDLDAYDGHSKMQYYTITGYSDDPDPVAIWGWKDSTMVWARRLGFVLRDNVWYDTIYAIGKSPIDRPSARFLRKPAGGGAPTEGTYVNHTDVLYTHFTITDDGVTRDYRDSVNVLREIFHNAPYTTLTTSSDLESKLFHYTAGAVENPADTAWTFTISGTYKEGNKVLSVSNVVVESSLSLGKTLNIAGTPCYRDTIWQVDGEGEYILDDEDKRIVDHVVLYDTLLVEALNLDGSTCEWVVATYLPARNQIRVKIDPYNAEATTNREAQIRYTYNYWHSSAVGDQVADSRVIRITQEWSGAGVTGRYAFNHSGTLADGLQAVHEKHNTIYAIPEEPLNLPLHRDYWGYYRWFNYDETYRDKDVLYNNQWSWTSEKNPKNNWDNDFMSINDPESASSRGRWDVIKDAEHTTNPLFAQDHFTRWTQTPVPAVNYPGSSTSGKIACDVSAYYNIQTDAAIGSNEFKSLTEPTLSYRQIFDIQPAQTRADQLLAVKGDGSGSNSNWLENYTFVAPVSTVGDGRAFTLQPQCPIDVSSTLEVDEEHLQYIYYFRPAATGHVDPDMGADPGSNYDKATTYNRIGKVRKTGDSKYRAQLISPSDITVGQYKNVIMVNPRKGTGYVLGKGNNFSSVDLPDSVRDGNTTTLQHFIEDEFLNTNDDYSGFKFTLQRESDGEVSLKHGVNYLWFDFNDGLIWDGNNEGWIGYSDWKMDFSAAQDAASSYITGTQASSVRLKMRAYPFIGVLIEKEGYITASAKACTRETWGGCARWGDYQRYLHIRNNIQNWGDNADQAWIFYEIINPDEEEHFETPRWEKWNGSAWTEVASWDYTQNKSVSPEGVTGYSMTADGALHIAEGVHTTVDAQIAYRLRTEHFQLAMFRGQIRSATNEILKLGNIISEEEIEHNYDIIYSLDMEHWPAPGTSDVVAYNYHFPWDFTELSYHYPLSAIGEDLRTDTLKLGALTTEMPMKGEYAFINKFVVPYGPTTENKGEEFECMAHAENGYMLCVNAAGKRTTIMNFDFDKLTCSAQQIYLVGNYCNPIKNGNKPEITADMEGSNDGVHWTRIYRYKSGKIPYKAHDDPNGHWFQMALPISRDALRGYAHFRCRAEINGSTKHNAHLLIDRLRFIERSRGFTVFQNKATCLKSDSVTTLIRLDFAADPTIYQPGKLVAYQFQGWNGSAWVPINASKTTDGGATYTALTHESGELKVFPGYMKDAFTATEAVTTPSLKSSTGNDYGYVMVPESDYDPSLSNDGNSSHQSALRRDLIEQAITKLSLTGSDVEARRAFINETGNIRTFDQVIDNNYVDFGSISTPHIKSFVKEGNKWVLYIVTRLAVNATTNNTFRVGMTIMNSMDDHPTFTEEYCATFHTFKVKESTTLRLNGDEWTNHPRTWYTGADPEHTLLPANDTYRADIGLSVDHTIQGHTTANPRCKFDFLHAAENVRANNAAGNEAFAAKYGCTRAEFVDAMATFRSDDENNTIRDEYEWAKVKPSDFEWSGRLPEQAIAIYNRLNKLINDGVLELGLDYRDIYMGDRADSWFYLMPVPASGRVDLVDGAAAGGDTTIHTSVCNDTLWLELHSQEPTAKLRFGYDSRVGDTYIVPTIRASRSEAMGEGGKYLDVRVAHMSTTNDAFAVVLGWEQTRLIGSNDPEWNGSKTFIYTQDKNMIGQTPNTFAYYTAGDAIHFTPKAGNNMALKAGYWYEFRAPFYAVAKENVYTADPLTPTGHSQFILAIAPDTVRWEPEHADAANLWNDDHNWTPVMHNIPEDGFKATVPMADTKVIIPEVAEGLAPIVSDVVEDQKDTLHYGYEKNTCSAILFYPGAEILGQERLTYNTAYVDVALKTGNWQTFSPALDDVYSGDMYIPFSTSYNPEPDPTDNSASTDTEDFSPKSFPFGVDYNKPYNPRVWPFAFYQGFYNSSVPVPYYNTDKDDMPVAADTVQSKSSVDWVKTNALNMHYKPGAASILTGYDATDADGNEIVIRLPKPDNIYYGFGRNGGENYVAGSAIEIERPNKMTRNLAYDQYATGFSTENGLTYELKNATESNIFFFGNPTMSLIDVYRLCVANESVLKHDGGTYSFTAYNLINGDNYDVRNINGPGQYFVLPQRAVGLVAATAAKTLSIKLTPSALVAYTGAGHLVNSETPDVASPMPRRAMHAAETVNQKRLYIAASNETDMGVKKAYLTLGEQTDAIRGYRFGEDALSIVSGLNYYSDESFSTPLSMYTIADNEALMLDIRDTLRYVPIVFTTLDNKFDYSEYTLLSFATEGNWTEPLYLCDALTGDSVRIANGMQIVVATPLSDQLRYYINGIRRIASGEEQQGTATGIDIVEDENTQPQTTNNNSQTTYVYDVLGRKVAVLGENDLLTRINLPTGVYIISRGDKTERIVIK